MSKTKKLLKDVKKQQDYAKDMKGKGTDIPTYAQYLDMTDAAKGVFRSGSGYKKASKFKRMGG